MVSAVGAYAQAVVSQSTTSRAATDTTTDAESDGTDTENPSTGGGGTVTDPVEISAEAQQRLQDDAAKNALQDAKVAYYAQFRPTRDGFSSSNMALGIVDPSAQPFSQNRPFADVAQAARDELDARYKQMNDSGQPYDSNSYEGVDDNSLYGNLDRRALYAVASNQGGLFTSAEQQRARDIMRGQQGMAMGGYNGPTRLAGKFASPITNDYEQIFKSGVQFMDKVSPEEKAGDVEWAVQRGSMQKYYEDQAKSNGNVPDNFNINHPLVNLVRAALDAWKNHPEYTSDGNTETADDLRKQPWFAPFADHLDSAIADTRALYGQTNA